jgi:hypothetical protein
MRLAASGAGLLGPSKPRSENKGDAGRADTKGIAGAAPGRTRKRDLTVAIEYQITFFVEFTYLLRN